MIIIAHRGRSVPTDPENDIDHIQKLHAQYPWMHFEIDLWYMDGAWLIGHEINEAVLVDFERIEMLRPKLLIHAKNTEAYQQLYYASKKLQNKFSYAFPTIGYNYFMHDSDAIGVSTWGWVIANYDVHPQHPETIIHPRSGNVLLSDLGPETYKGVLTDDPLIFYGYWSHRV